jgi:hypothetical membrane protein
MMYKMEKLNGFYEKFPGSYLAYALFVFSVCFLSIAALLYSNAESSFSLLTTYISDLGAASRDSSLVFAIGMIISSPLRVVFGLYLLKWLEKRDVNKKTLRNTAIAMVIGAIGSIALAMFPHDVFRLLQNSAGNPSRLFYNMLNSAEFKMLIADRMHKHMLFLTFEISEIIFEGFRYIAIFLEWLAYFTIMAWLVMHGYYIQRSK